MTTIAFKDGVLATDTLMTRGTSVGGFTRKVRHIQSGEFENCLVGLAGSYAVSQLAFTWVSDGAVFEDAPDVMRESENDSDLFLLRPDGSVVWFWRAMRMDHDNEGLRTRQNAFATGSGEDYAMGAMAAGMGAADAVRIAMQFDRFTGGDVMIYESDGVRFHERAADAAITPKSDGGVPALAFRK